MDLKSLEMMIRIRAAELKIASGVESGRVTGPCHLAIGQEAIAVGVARHLKKFDKIFGNHRSHSHYLAVGGSLLSLFSEVLGRSTGCSSGRGGSMHLTDVANGFIGSVPIVAGTIPIAVGAALAIKKSRGRGIAVAFFGDGASEEGVFHESLNFASFMKLPILFVCENNLFSSHLHLRMRQPSTVISRYAKANRILSKTVDGNNLKTIIETAGEFIAGIRQDRSPRFLEAKTYRWLGHVGHREDLDVGLNRRADVRKWRNRDAVERLKRDLAIRKKISNQKFERLKSRVEEEVEKAWDLAISAPFPKQQDLLKKVYQ